MSFSIKTSENLTFTPFLWMIIFLLILLTQTTMDIYLPSLPAIKKTFGSEESVIQLTLSFFFLGLSLSHLFYGPLSDRIGRKTPILFGVALSAGGSLVCLFSSTTAMLILGRFIQGFGIGCCNSVGRSLARDLLSKGRLAYVGSYFGMVSVLIMALSPTLGGYIQEYLGWRANFLFLVVFSISLWLLMLVGLPETNKHLNPNATKIPIMLNNGIKVLSNKTFLGYTFCSCFAFAGIASYFIISPFLFQEILGLTPAQFGLQTFFIAGAIFFSGLINSRLVLKKGVHHMMMVGIIFMMLGAISMVCCMLFGMVTLFSILTSMVFFSMGAGLTFINAFAGAFDPFPKIAGMAGALYASLQDLSAGFTCGFIASLKCNNQFILCISLLMFAIFSLIAWKFIAPAQITFKNSEVVS